MNKKQLKQYIENTRDCDESLLDIAVNKGLSRAKSEQVDFKKLINLAAMCAATLVICITMSLEPVRIEAAEFLVNTSLVSQSGSEALFGYLNDIKSVLKTYLGGD